ncbi:response regulator [Paenibacillus sp. HB172176]|uniref:response regulator n=1 Tax=Paenibacillus sp. HB172176 TaxID=2493690 RepID=UPI0014395447|nr:response regulator [Paenibacillus sp. HB172176]
MLQLLIVDDEQLAVDYLIEALEDWPDFPMTITKAYSGKEALEKIEHAKVDVLLTDIHMPGMNGMELAEEIKRRWPRCRVIFLTGYNDFDYVQSALRKGGVDYVLKTEGDEMIVRALKKAVASIETELGKEEILQKARQQVHLALPFLRREYLTEFLLGGEVEIQAARRNRFKELAIDLEPEHSVFAVLGRIDDWGSFSSPSDHLLLSYSIHNIAEEYFREAFRCVSFSYDQTRLVWLLQPPKELQQEERVQDMLERCTERIQSACGSLLKIPVSIAWSSQPSEWEGVANRLENLKMQLAFRMGSGEAMLVSDEMNESAKLRSSRSAMEIGRLRSAVHKLDLLESVLDDGNRDKFVGLYDEWFEVDLAVISDQGDKWFGLEIFSRISAFFLTYMNKRGLFANVGIGTEFSTDKIYNPDRHANLQEMIRFFSDMGIRIAEYTDRSRIERSHDVIRRVHEYIHQFLHEELSLTKLADLVYLSPPYFSRLYKQVTGKGLLEYINETRIQKAKLLLKTTDKKINEISVEIGLESASYFTRLFRKKNGVTPQEYRDSSKGMETF